MKQRIIFFYFIAIMLLISGCKKPYELYKTTYKTAGAQQFFNATTQTPHITPAQAIKKNIKHMTLAEARAARIYYEEHNEIELIEKVLTHLIKLSDNYQEKADCLYELATIHLSLGRLEKARELFEQVIRDYPGVPCKREAAYRLILAHYWDCRKAMNDQDMTEKTLQLIQTFMQEYPHEIEFAANLAIMHDECYKLLFDGELLRMEYYLTKYQVFNESQAVESARMRATYILEKLLEQQKNISSQTKDRILDHYTAINAIPADNIQEKYRQLCLLVELLAGRVIQIP